MSNIAIQQMLASNVRRFSHVSNIAIQQMLVSNVRRFSWGLNFLHNNDIIYRKYLTIIAQKRA